MDSLEPIKKLGTYVIGGNKNAYTYYLYKCSKCGKEYEATKATVKNKKSTICKSCSSVKRAAKHGDYGTRLYRIWNQMKYIAKGKTKDVYAEYKVGVCVEWEECVVFKAWALSNGYEDTLTIDRIDNYKGYSPDNRRWVTMKLQNQTKRLLSKTNSTGYKGVTLIKSSGKYKASIYYNGKNKVLGHHNTAKEAALAYNTFCDEHGLENTRNIL